MLDTPYDAEKSFEPVILWIPKEATDGTKVEFLVTATDSLGRVDEVKFLTGTRHDWDQEPEFTDRLFSVELYFEDSFGETSEPVKFNVEADNITDAHNQGINKFRKHYNSIFKILKINVQRITEESIEQCQLNSSTDGCG